MAASLSTRKPIDALTLKDLEAYPIWEFCTDEEDNEGMDETWVKPLNAKRIPRNMYSLNVVCDFTTAQGDAFKGFVGVTTIDKKVEIDGGVILDGLEKYLFIPNTKDRFFKKMSTNLAAGLGVKKSGLFPITCALAITVVGEKNALSTELE